MIASGPITYGIWCDTCLAPSAGTWETFYISAAGVAPICQWTACPDCHTGVG